MPQHMKGQRTALWSPFSLHLYVCSGMQLRLPGLHSTILPYHSTNNLSGCLLGVLIALFWFCVFRKKCSCPVSLCGYALRSGTLPGTLCPSCLPLFPSDLYASIKFDLILKVFASFHHLNRQFNRQIIAFPFEFFSCVYLEITVQSAVQLLPARAVCLEDESLPLLLGAYTVIKRCYVYRDH